MDIDIYAAEVQYVGVESFLASFENVTGWTYSASGKDAIIVGRSSSVSGPIRCSR